MPYKQLVNVAKMFVAQTLAAKMSTANMHTANVSRTLGTMVLKYTPDTGNCPAYNNCSTFLGTLYSLKNFKCTFAATNHQVNNLPKTRTPGEE